MAVRQAVKKPKEFLIVTNQRYEMVTLTHPDTRAGVTIMPLQQHALDMAWEDIPDIQKLVANGHIQVSYDSKRPAPRATIPGELTTRLSAMDRAAGEQIAFNTNQDIVNHMINVMPRLEVPNANQNDPNVDGEYLKSRHLLILKIAEWYLDNWQPGYIDWHGRLAHVRERIQFLQDYKP